MININPLSPLTPLFFLFLISSSVINYNGIVHKREMSGAFSKIFATGILALFVFLFTPFNSSNIYFLIAVVCILFKDIIFGLQISKYYLPIALAFASVAYVNITLSLLPYANFSNFVWPIPFLFVVGLLIYLFVAKNIGKWFIPIILFLVVLFSMVEIGCISSSLSVFGLATILILISDFNVLCYNYSDDYSRIINSDSYEFAVFIPWNVGLILLVKGITGV